MKGRLRVLCLMLFVAGAISCATGALAADPVEFTVPLEGWAVASGVSVHYPELDVTCVAEADDNALDVVRVTAMFKLDDVMGTISEGQVALITADGYALYARVPSGSVTEEAGAPGSFVQVCDLEFAGGTGPYTGVRGTGTLTATRGSLLPATPGPVTPVNLEEAVVSGTLVLGDAPEEMVTMQTREGALADIVPEPEAFPLLFQEDTHTGYATHCGKYANWKRSLLDFSALLNPTGPPLIPFRGFFIKTVADGEVMEGYYEGVCVPTGPVPTDALALDMQLWVTGGTGRFADASGQEAGGGFIWQDGREEIRLEGKISAPESIEE